MLEDLELPPNYFEMSDEDRKDVCVGLLETIYEIIIKNNKNNVNKVELFHKVLDMTIEINEKNENYELCGLLYDTKRLLDEQTSNGLHK